ncbi:MAG: matrixin family metalloprotease [Anaerolineae bacterium]
MPQPRSASEIFEELKQTKHKITIDALDYYLVEGDLRLDENQLLLYAFELAEQEQRKAGGASGEQREPLVGIVDDEGRIVRWKKGLVLTYNVLRSSFASDAQYQTVVQAMRVATADWEAACGVNFKHLGELDGGVAPGSQAPLFRVRQFNAGGRFIAMAFFPDEPLDRREVIIDPSFFAPTLRFDRAGVLRHELGHVLGFRHEHILSEAPAICPDEALGNIIQLSDYDPRSVMHYFCGGADFGTRDLKITDVDRTAARKVYGPPDSEVHYCA